MICDGPVDQLGRHLARQCRSTGIAIHARRDDPAVVQEGELCREALGFGCGRPFRQFSKQGPNLGSIRVGRLLGDAAAGALRSGTACWRSIPWAAHDLASPRRVTAPRTIGLYPTARAQPDIGGFDKLLGPWDSGRGMTFKLGRIYRV